MKFFFRHTARVLAVLLVIAAAALILACSQANKKPEKKNAKSVEQNHPTFSYRSAVSDSTMARQMEIEEISQQISNNLDKREEHDQTIMTILYSVVAFIIVTLLSGLLWAYREQIQSNKDHTLTIEQMGVKLVDIELAVAGNKQWNTGFKSVCKIQHENIEKTLGNHEKRLHDIETKDSK